MAPEPPKPADASHLTLLHVFTGFDIGGAQVRFAAVANHFGRRYRHLIVAMRDGMAARERLNENLDVAFPEIAIRQQTMFGNVLPFRRALRALVPDVLVTHNWGSLEWAMANLLRDTRHVHIEDGFGPEERDRQIRRRILTRRLVLRRSTVVLPSRTLERIAADIWQLPRARLRYVPNGIDLARFAVPGNRAGGVAIGAAASLQPVKALDRLLRAFAALPHSQPEARAARLRIAGDGPERPALDRLARELGIADRVDFLGHVSDTASFYATLDIVALSSDTEQMPLSIVEAMASGLPVVATDVGDVRIMVAPENRAFIVPRDDAALARALGALAADTTLRARIGAANCEKARREYDQERMFVAYGALFDGAIGGGGSASQSRSE